MQTMCYDGYYRNNFIPLRMRSLQRFFFYVKTSFANDVVVNEEQ